MNRTLRRRNANWLFGDGKPVAHAGGRALWQVSDLDALVDWKAVPGDPSEAERLLLADFKERFGRLPFANFRS